MYYGVINEANPRNVVRPPALSKLYYPARTLYTLTTLHLHFQYPQRDVAINLSLNLLFWVSKLSNAFCLRITISYKLYNTNNIPMNTIMKNVLNKKKVNIKMINQFMSQLPYLHQSKSEYKLIYFAVGPYHCSPH